MHYKKVKKQRTDTVTTSTTNTNTNTPTAIISTPTTITSTNINTDYTDNINTMNNLDNIKEHIYEPVGSNIDTSMHNENSTSNGIIQIRENIIPTNNQNSLTKELSRSSTCLDNTKNTNTNDDNNKGIQKHNRVSKKHRDSGLIPGTIIINSSLYEKNSKPTAKSKVRKIKHKEQVNLKEREINDLTNKKGRKMRKDYTLPPKPSKNDNGYKLDIRKYKAAKEYLSNENTTSLKEVSKKYKISVPTLITYMDSERVKEFMKTGKYSASSALRAKRNSKNQYDEHSKREARKINYLQSKNQHYGSNTSNNDATNNFSQEYNKNKTFQGTSTDDDDDDDEGAVGVDIPEEHSQYYEDNYGDDDEDNGDSDNDNANDDVGEYNRLRFNSTPGNNDNYNKMINIPSGNKHVMQTTKSVNHSNVTSSALSTINSRDSLLNENIETYDTPIFPNNEQYHLSEEEEQENQNRYRVETFRRKSTNGLNTDEKVTSIKKIISDMQSTSSFGAQTGLVPTSRSKSLDTGSVHARVQDLPSPSKRNSESNIDISRSMNPFDSQMFHKNITVEKTKGQSNAHEQQKDQYENTGGMQKPTRGVSNNDTDFKQSQPKNFYQGQTYISDKKDEMKSAQGHRDGSLVNINSSNKKFDEMTTKTKNYSSADNENITGGPYPPGSEHGYIKPTDFFPFNSDNASKSYYNSAFSRGNAMNAFAPSPMTTYQQSSSYHPQTALYHFAQQQMQWSKVPNYPNYPNIMQQSMPYFDIFQNQLNMSQLQNTNSGPDNSLQQQSISSPLAAGNYVPVLSSGPGQAVYRDQKAAAQDWEYQSQIIRPHPNNNHFYFPSHYEMKSPPPGPAVSASGPSGYQNHIQQTVPSVEFGEQSVRKNIGTAGNNIGFSPNASKVSREKIDLAYINKSHQHNELEADSDFQNKYNLLFEEFQKKFKDLLDGRSEDLQIFYAKHMEQKMNTLFYPYSIESMLRSRENPRLTSKPNSRDSMLEYVPVFQQPSTTASGYNTYGISEETSQSTSFTTTASASGVKGARPSSTDADKLSKLFSTNNTRVESLRSSSKKKNKKVPPALNLNQTVQKFGQQVSAPFLSPPNTTLTAKNQDRSALKFDGSSQNTEINEELYKSDFENEDKHLHGSESNTYTQHST